LAYFRRKEEYEPIFCDSPEELLKHISEGRTQIVVVDQDTLEEIGLNFLRSKLAVNAIIIAITASRDLDLLEFAVNKGSLFKYHPKPFELDDLNKSIEEAANTFK
ncbi:MAG TPA: hypothetical protein VK750_01540, partial [Cytophagaceae bacterium]|nr:hypothetical protein [Cytophagaceae bacterium]